MLFIIDVIIFMFSSSKEKRKKIEELKFFLLILLLIHPPQLNSVTIIFYELNFLIYDSIFLFAKILIVNFNCAF